MSGPPDGAITPPLSILHLCAPAHVGGLERVVQGLSIGQARRGHAVTAVAVVEPGTTTGPFLDPIRAAGARTVVVELPGRAYLGEVKAVRRLLGELRPDVLHTHGYRPDLLHALRARRAGIATVSTLHGSSRMGGASHFFEWLQLRALRHFDAVVAVSPALRREMMASGIPGDRIHLVPNAWTPPPEPLDRSAAREALGVPPDVPLIGWIGRLIRIKGADVLLRALGRMADVEWRASVVGDGPERAALEEIASAEGISDRVRFHGAIDDAARLLAAFDVFVLSSRSEGTPMVLLEAMGASVPVIATRVGGVPDVLDPRSREGWLVAPESPPSLAEALRAALMDRSEAEGRGARGHDRVLRDFGFDTWITRHESVYRSAVARRSADR